jgi:polar amino acid transport system substrate-binding protein
MFTAAYVTASITSSMTAERLSNSIENLRDLQNKTVSVIADSPAEDFIKDQGIDEIPASDIQSAVNELLENRVQAVVADAAVLQSFDSTTRDFLCELWGGFFKSKIMVSQCLLAAL